MENNLEKLFNLKFIATKFALEDLRMDTLAFNEETNSFIIIEYQIKENYSVIDHGYGYLFLLLDRKADFVIKYNETFGTNLDYPILIFLKLK